MLSLPDLPFASWKETRVTLHLIAQIIGKIRLACMPRKNHWWYVTLYLSTDGFSTHPIPLPDGLHTFSMTIHVHKKMVILKNSKGEQKEMPLQHAYAIGTFYQDILRELGNWGVHPHFVDRPLDMQIDKPFDTITEYHHYDWEAIHKFWLLMMWNDGIFKEFSGRFYGKTCPVHLYWHHLDLTVTRFSGKQAPPVDAHARILEKDAYSHEVISFGFWAGDEDTPEPTYYSYTHPSPPTLAEKKIPLSGARWIDANGSPMAILPYAEVRSSTDPRKMVLDFLEHTYQAGAQLANWDIEALRVPPLEDL